MRAAAIGLAGLATIFGVSFGALEVGLRTPSAADRIAARVLGELERTRGVRAVLDVDGRRLLATCHSYLGRDLVQLSDGTQLVVVGVHAFRTLPPRGSLIDAVSDRRQLFVARGSAGNTVSAQAAIAGSHSFWARVLGVRLEQANVQVRVTRYRGRAAYEVRLNKRPLLELVVDRATLRPVAAFYRSRAFDASSRLIASRHAVRGC